MRTHACALNLILFHGVFGLELIFRTLLKPGRSLSQFTNMFYSPFPVITWFIQPKYLPIVFLLLLHLFFVD
jgi:hypothetical protein